MRNAQQMNLWRLKAEELRAIADQMTISLARKTLESMAIAYDAMAARAEGYPPAAVTPQLCPVVLLPQPVSLKRRLRHRRRKPQP